MESIMVLVESIWVDVTIARFWIFAAVRYERIRRSWPIENLSMWVSEILNIFIDLFL